MSDDARPGSPRSGSPGPDSPGPCPVCKRELSEVLQLGQEFLGCHECRGVFFCEDGLANYVVASTLPSVEPVFRRLLDQALAAAPRQTTSIRACPLCAGKLQRFGFGERPLAILDHCPNDRAVWLDEGDLSKVVRVCRTEALVTGAMDDADGDGVADALEGPEDGAAPGEGARVSAPPAKDDAPWACPNCGGFFAGGPKCPDCNVVGYQR